MPPSTKPRNAAAVILLALALGACTTVGPNFVRPAAPTAPGYAMAGDRPAAAAVLSPQTRAAGPWWRAMGSDQLDAVMVQALAGNPSLAQADASLARAREAARSVAGSLAPQFDASAGAQRERINTEAFGISGFPSPTITLYSIGPSVSYDLDLFGGGRRRREEAIARAEGVGRQADAAYLALTGQVAMDAVKIADARARISAVDAIVADDEENLAIVHRAEAAGGEPPSASNVGEAQLDADRALRPPLAQQLEAARHDLAALVGRSPGEWIAPDFDLQDFKPPATIPVSLPSQLVRKRPDILAAEADLHADTAAIGVATADLYPDIRLTASLTQEAISPDKLFSFASTAYSFGPSLTTPLLHGGSLRANQRGAQDQARSSLARYRQTVLSAFVQVADVLSALAWDDERIAALDQADRTAGAALTDARNAYKLGGGALLAVTTAQRQRVSAQLDLADARAQRLQDIVQLFAATASDWR